MEAIDDSAMKYSFKDNDANGGFSFSLWRVGKMRTFKLYIQKLRRKRDRWQESSNCS